MVLLSLSSTTALLMQIYLHVFRQISLSLSLSLYIYIYIGSKPHNGYDGRQKELRP